jgi:hypothetical protein
MTLPASGTITLAQIQTEFGGSNPIGLNEYYKGGSYVTTNDFAPNVPASGVIRLSNFYGAKKNTLNNLFFTSSTTWVLPSTSNGILDVCVVGGGGGGGSSSDYWNSYGANGGAGGIASQRITGLIPGNSYSIVVGTGGARGLYGYGYPSNPYADGFNGIGGGESSAFGVIAGGGGGGGGGTPGYNGTNGGGIYGGAGSGATSGTAGGNGSGTGNYLSYGGGGFGVAGTASGAPYAHTPQSTAGTDGNIFIRGYW